MLAGQRLQGFHLPPHRCFRQLFSRENVLLACEQQHCRAKRKAVSVCRASTRPVDAELVSDSGRIDGQKPQRRRQHNDSESPQEQYDETPAEIASFDDRNAEEGSVTRNTDIEGENGEEEDSDEEETGLVEQEDIFHTILMEGCEVLIRTTEDGRFDFQDVYIWDPEVEIYAEPEKIGAIPTTPQLYLMEEWKEEFSGDTLMEKPGWEKLLKLYFVQVDDEHEDLRLKLEEVFCIDAETRTLRKEEVTWLTEERNPQNVTLRIKPDGCAIEENSEMIDEYMLVEEWHNEQEMERRARAEEEDEQYLFQEEPAGPRDPIDALNDDDREYDETLEDTPEVDQGY